MKRMLNECHHQILLFARYPQPGRAKSRLIPALGPDGAARLHRRMTEVVVDAAKVSGADVIICATGALLRRFRAWLGPQLRYLAQPSGDLGQRMEHAFADTFRAGAELVLAIGADVPTVTPDILRQAFERLSEVDVVLGPAVDGGYYLIGMKRFRPELFADMDWGTERVCAQTRAAIEYLGLTVAELPKLNDVDRPEDLPSLRVDPRFAGVWTRRPLISVIVPTLNEATSLGRTLERVRRADSVEIIVADGGSGDATREIAAQAGAVVLEVAGGRAAQQNAGAAAAKGGVLIFLHADTLLPDSYADLIRWVLDCPATVAGAFRFRTDGAGLAMRLIEWGANVRSVIFQWPYGDQGLFMEKRIFDELGGFAALPIMEDFEIVRRLRRRGRVVILPQCAITSARRWLSLGIVCTTLRNQAMILGFLCGVAPERLERFYRNKLRSR